MRIFMSVLVIVLAAVALADLDGIPCINVTAISAARDSDLPVQGNPYRNCDDYVTWELTFHVNEHIGQNGGFVAIIDGTLVYRTVLVSSYPIPGDYRLEGTEYSGELTYDTQRLACIGGSPDGVFSNIVFTARYHD